MPKGMGAGESASKGRCGPLSAYFWAIEKSG
jgi:hypothetical protein